MKMGMMKGPGRTWAVLAVALLLIGQGLTVPARDALPAGSPHSRLTEAFTLGARNFSAPDQDGRFNYIVRLSEAPVAAYAGDLPGYGAITPSASTGPRRDVHSPQAAAYRAYLAERQDTTLDAIQATCGRHVEPLARFDTALNGLALRLTPKEAERVARLSGVAAVERETIVYPNSDRSAEFTNATPIWTGEILPTSPTLATRGEGLVIAVIDTGITPENPSFAEVDGLGYVHTNPRGRMFGVGDPEHPEYDPDFPLNAKLIGAYDMVPAADPEVAYDPREYKSHGSHVASTAAGAFTTATLPLGDDPADALTTVVSGIAPRANLITYKIEHPNGGARTVSVLSAIEQAILDEVDVINYSYGGGTASPWEGASMLAYHSAVEAGVFVVTSAGNDGPDPFSITNPGVAPWMTAVANSTHDRLVRNSVIAMTREDGVALEDLIGLSLTAAYGPAPIVFAGDYENINDPDGDPAQALEPFPVGTFDGEIVVVYRGTIARVDKGKNVLQGGAGGMILINTEEDGADLSTDNHFLPAVHLTFTQGQMLLDWMAESENHMGTIAGSRIEILPEYGDQISLSSSRGPFQDYAMIRPDIAAPGTSILAATPPHDDGSPRWDFLSGTSMASPQVAGAGALLRALYPDWTPTEIRSALMLTAETDLSRQEDGLPATAFDMGAGRINVARAARTGLVMDETTQAFLDANPAQGGDLTTLNMPSITGFHLETDTFTRTVRSAVSVPVTWTVSAESDPLLMITVAPETFTLAPGATQDIVVTAQVDVPDYNDLEHIVEGSVRLTPDNADVQAARLPVAIRVVPITLSMEPFLLSQVAAEGSATLTDLKAVEIEDLTIQTYGVVPATLQHGYLHQGHAHADPNNPDPRDGLAGYNTYVDEDCRLLAVEILETSSRNLDLRIINLNNGKTYDAVTDKALEALFLVNPPTGSYRILVFNYEASDTERDNPDFFKLAIATAYEDDLSDDITVEESLGRTAIPEGEPFDLNFSWDLTDREGYHFYGLVDLGPNADHPGALGSLPLALHLEGEPAPPTISGRFRLSDGRSLDEIPALLRIQDGQGQYAFTIDGDGHYTIQQPEGWSGDMTPAMRGWTSDEHPVFVGYYFLPLKRGIPSLEESRVGEDFLGHPRPMLKAAFEQYYQVVYRPQGGKPSEDGWVYGSVGIDDGVITILHRYSNPSDTLKIVRRPQYRNTPSEELPPIGLIQADAGLRHLYSEAWIERLQTYNTFSNITMRDAGVLEIKAATMGQLRIANRAPVEYNQVNIDLSYPLPPPPLGRAERNARINLVGYQLANLDAMEQEFQFIRASSRKVRAGAEMVVVPGGIVRDNNYATTWLDVASINQIVVNGGSISTDIMFVPGLRQVLARGMVFTGPGLRAAIPGHIDAHGLLAFDTPQTQLRAIAGNISATFILLSGDLPLIAAQHRPAVGGGYVGYGTDDTPQFMMVQTGADPFRTGNIGRIHGDRGVNGLFIANPTGMLEDSITATGMVRLISTRRDGTLEGTSIYMRSDREPRVIPPALRSQVIVNDQPLN